MTDLFTNRRPCSSASRRSLAPRGGETSKNRALRPTGQPKRQLDSPNADARPYGDIVHAAYEIVEDMGEEPFTKPDLAERLRQKGYELKRAKNGHFYATQWLLADGIIKRIQQGSGNRADVHHGGRRAEGSQSTECTEGNDIGTSASLIPRLLRFRNGMERSSPSGFKVNMLFSGAWRKISVRRLSIWLAEMNPRGLAHA